jgi:hypothetical protein
MQRQDETAPAHISADHITKEINALRSQYLETVGVAEYVSASESLARLLCHWAIDLIPREGLIELVEQIFQILTFYSDRKISTPQLPSPDRLVKGKIGTSITRPTFSITEDE